MGYRSFLDGMGIVLRCGCVVLSSPVRLHEHGVDLGEFDGAGLVADGFEEASEAEVACAP